MIHSSPHVCRLTLQVGGQIGRCPAVTGIPSHFPLSALLLGQARQAMFCFCLRCVCAHSLAITHMASSGASQLQRRGHGRGHADTDTNTAASVPLPGTPMCIHRCRPANVLVSATANMKGKAHPVRYSARHICGFPPDAPLPRTVRLHDWRPEDLGSSRLAYRRPGGVGTLTACDCHCHNCHRRDCQPLLRCQTSHLSLLVSSFLAPSPSRLALASHHSVQGGSTISCPVMIPIWLDLTGYTPCSYTVQHTHPLSATFFACIAVPFSAALFASLREIKEAGRLGGCRRKRCLYPMFCQSIGLYRPLCR